MTDASAVTRALYRVDSGLENGIADDSSRTDHERHAIYLALSGIRSAESRIESAAYWLRSTMECASTALAGDMNLGGCSLIQQASAYDQACEARDLHWAALAALLDETELAGYRTARAAARHPAAEGDPR